MGLTDSLKRLMGSGGDEERGPAYECSTCGREYETRRAVCVDCNGHVQAVSDG